MSYWPVWLRDRGVTDTEIGTLFMSRQIVAVIATLSVGWIAHRLGGPRGVLVTLGLAAIVMVVRLRVLHTRSSRSSPSP